MNSEHPDLETLAGIADADDPAALSPPASASPDGSAVLDHVAGCAACTADIAAIRDVRETLRSLPPVPMPPEVATRLEAALLAAREPVTNITPFTSRAATKTARAARWRTIPLSAAAAVVVLAALVVGGVVGLGHVGNNSEKRSVTAAAPAAAATSADQTTIASGTSYTSDQLRTQVAAIVSSRVPGAAQRYPGLNDPDLALAAAGGSAPAAAAASSAPSAASAPTAAAAPRTEAARSGPPFAAAASSAAATGATTHANALAPNSITAPTGPLADPAALASCIRALAGKAEQPVLVDYATFDGVPSTIIVFADPDVPNKLDIYVEANTANCATEVTFAAFLPAPVDSSP